MDADLHEAAELAFRLAAAATMGAVLGADRQRLEKPAGLRTHMLVALAAAALTVLSFRLAEQALAASQNMAPDPVRIVEAVVTGVAFLGAGAIIRGRGTIQGFTTGASMWLAGAVGLACGAGEFALAAIAVAIGLFVLLPLRWLEEFLWPAHEDRRDDGAENSRSQQNRSAP